MSNRLAIAYNLSRRNRKPVLPAAAPVEDIEPDPAPEGEQEPKLLPYQQSALTAAAKRAALIKKLEAMRGESPPEPEVNEPAPSEEAKAPSARASDPQSIAAAIIGKKHGPTAPEPEEELLAADDADDLDESLIADEPAEPAADSRQVTIGRILAGIRSRPIP